jgi:hypothetical protein
VERFEEGQTSTDVHSGQSLNVKFATVKKQIDLISTARAIEESGWIKLNMI